MFLSGGSEGMMVWGWWKMGRMYGWTQKPITESVIGFCWATYKGVCVCLCVCVCVCVCVKEEVWEMDGVYCWTSFTHYYECVCVFVKEEG
jgi:hypothetical protein